MFGPQELRFLRAIFFVCPQLAEVAVHNRRSGRPDLQKKALSAARRLHTEHPQ